MVDIITDSKLTTSERIRIAIQMLRGDDSESESEAPNALADLTVELDKVFGYDNEDDRTTDIETETETEDDEEPELSLDNKEYMAKLKEHFNRRTKRYDTAEKLLKRAATGRVLTRAQHAITKLKTSYNELTCIFTYRED